MGLIAAAGCGDSSGGGEEGGGNTTTSSSGTGGTATGTGSGGEGAGGGASCTEVTSDDFTYEGAGLFNYFYGGSTNPTLGGAGDDAFSFMVYDPGITGTIDLGSAENANFATCMGCLLVLEDLDADGNPGRIYFQESGTLELGTTTPYYLAGSFSDVSLVEITIDPDTGESTPVENGACLHVNTIAFDVQPPAAGWTCDPLYHGGADGCDCECGAVDPDCTDPNADLYGCLEGQTCSAEAHCEGVPTAWTCDQAAWEDGANCDCDCGAPDPDCANVDLPVLNCVGGEVCGEGKCLPDTWTCSPAYWEDGAYCDCNCGGVDPDCSVDPPLPVFGCEDPSFTGVCLPDGTCEEA
jgi:hypothetical protein